LLPTSWCSAGNIKAPKGLDDLHNTIRAPVHQATDQRTGTVPCRTSWAISVAQIHKAASLKGLLWGCPGIRLGVELTESKPWVMNVHVNTVIKIIAANNSDYAPAHAAIAA
jgi:hypothetical protein